MKITLNFIIMCIFFLIKLNKNTSLIKAFRILGTDRLRTILTLANENVTLEFKKDTPTDYCKFIHPNGKIHSISVDDVNSRDCSVQIVATSNNTGIWQCHMGREADNEVIKKLELWVVGQLTAVNKYITVTQGTSATLACVTVENATAVRNCRFNPPWKPTYIELNESMTHSNPVMQRYYFPRNMSLDAGHCAVTIHETVKEDHGVWRCNATLYDGRTYFDDIWLILKGNDTTTANDKVSSDMFVLNMVLSAMIMFGCVLLCVSRTRMRLTDIEMVEMRPSNLIF